MRLVVPYHRVANDCVCADNVASVEMPEVQAVKRSEVLLKDVFCVFELIETEEQFKQHMQAPVAIDFLARTGDGYALFRGFLSTRPPCGCFALTQTRTMCFRLFVGKLMSLGVLCLVSTFSISLRSNLVALQPVVGSPSARRQKAKRTPKKHMALYSKIRWQTIEFTCSRAARSSSQWSVTAIQAQ